MIEGLCKQCGSSEHRFCVKSGCKRSTLRTAVQVISDAQTGRRDEYGTYLYAVSLAAVSGNMSLPHFIADLYGKQVREVREDIWIMQHRSNPKLVKPRSLR